MGCVCKMAADSSTGQNQFFAFPEKLSFLIYGTFEARVRYIYKHKEIKFLRNSFLMVTISEFLFTALILFPIYIYCTSFNFFL